MQFSFQVLAFENKCKETLSLVLADGGRGLQMLEGRHLGAFPLLLLGRLLFWRELLIQVGLWGSSRITAAQRLEFEGFKLDRSTRLFGWALGWWQIFAHFNIGGNVIGAITSGSAEEISLLGWWWSEFGRCHFRLGLLTLIRLLLLNLKMEQE